MNKVLIVFLISFQSFYVYAKCSPEDANDVLKLIVENHPKNTLNQLGLEKAEALIQKAGQRPNPELDIEASMGESNEGDSYRATLRLQHVFELGGKRRSRIELARRVIAEQKNRLRLESQQIVVESVVKLNRLRQIEELVPLYRESLDTFKKILGRFKKGGSLSPEQMVESETLDLVINDYSLKISQLKMERLEIVRQIDFSLGPHCSFNRKFIPQRVALEEIVFAEGNLVESPAIALAKANLDFANSSYELEKAKSYPDLRIGPVIEYEKLNLNQSNSLGIAVSMDLPVLNSNSGGKEVASKEVLVASRNLANIEEINSLDLQLWFERYRRYRASLRTLASEKKLEEKHEKIESLFKRGIVSTSLVIESHRQLIEFFRTRYDFEIGAIEALWNIYLLRGDIEGKKLI